MITLGATVGVMVAGTLVGFLALWTAPQGSDPETFFAPASSPLLNDPRWIAGLISANALGGFAALFAGLRFLRVDPRPLFPAPQTRIRSYAGAILLVVGIAPFADNAAQWVASLTGTDATSARIAASAALGGSGLEFAVVLLAFAIAPAVVEELLFRGLVTASLLGHGLLIALVGQSAMFGLYHLELAQGMGTAILGLAFGWIRLQTGSILPSMLAHGAYNSLVLIALRTSGSPPTPDSDIGARSAMIAVGVMMCGVGLVLLRKPSDADDQVS